MAPPEFFCCDVGTQFMPLAAFAPCTNGTVCEGSPQCEDLRRRKTQRHVGDKAGLENSANLARCHFVSNSDAVIVTMATGFRQHWCTDIVRPGNETQSFAFVQPLDDLIIILDEIGSVPPTKIGQHAQEVMRSD